MKDVTTTPQQKGQNDEKEQKATINLRLYEEVIIMVNSFSNGIKQRDDEDEGKESKFFV